MAAVVGSVNGSVPGASGQKRVRFGSVEPAVLAVLEQLDPLVAVLSLLVCMLVYRVPCTPALSSSTYWRAL